MSGDLDWRLEFPISDDGMVIDAKAMPDGMG